MKQLLFGVLFFLLGASFSSLTAQTREDIPPKPTDETYEHVPFPTDNAIWTNRSLDNFYAGSEGGFDRNFFSSIFMKGDTIWEGHTYSKLYLCKGETPDYSPDAFWGGLREENKRIYIRQSKTFKGDPYALPLLYPTGNNSVYLDPDFKEHLYYDFNISANPEEIIAQFGMADYVKYDRSDYEWIGGRWRRVIYFKANYSGDYNQALFTFRWIDGIGNDRGFAYNGSAITTGNNNYREANLLCFFQDGEQLYHADNIIFPFEGSDDCFRIDDLLLEVSGVASADSCPIRYEAGCLVWGKALFSRVRLYDMQAQHIFSAEVSGMTAVDLKGSIPSGVYLYCAEDASGNCHTGKVRIP